MSFGTTQKLNGTGGGGITIPQIGLGTWLSAPNEVEKAVEVALKEGYLHLDLAKIYQNQDEVARGIKKSGVSREKIFITSKLWNTWHRPDQVAAGLDDTLKELELDYLDLYLIHWPVAFAPGTGDGGKNELFPATNKVVDLDAETSLVDTWKEMIKLQKSGKVKAIGVSNFTIQHLEGIINATGVVPAVNQIERHPLLIQQDLIDYAKSKSIHITAYSPLGNNLKNEKKIVEYPEVLEIAKKKNVDPAQVLIAWGKFGGHSVIPKSVTPSRIKSNFEEIELTEDEFKALNALGEKVVRFNTPIGYSPKWDINVFGDESEKGASATVKIGA